MGVVARKPKKRVHREWFRCVDRGGRKSCPNCKAKLEPGELIWSWGEYVRAKFRHIEDVCKNCWGELVEKLKAHAGDCGCTFELEVRGAPRPAWLTMEHPACVTTPTDNR
jgi:transposase